jgi:hypothetical protein
LFTQTDTVGFEQVGEYKNDSFTFNGETTYNELNGDIIKGCWENYKVTGKGICEYGDGSIYEGDFVDG